MIWEMTTTGRMELLSELRNSSTDLFLSAKFSFKRNSANNNVVSYEYRLNLLDMRMRNQLADAIYFGNNASVNVTGIFPRVLKMPGSSAQITSPCDRLADACSNVTVQLSYLATETGGDALNFWSMRQIPDTNITQFSSNSVTQVLLINTPVSDGDSILGSLAAYGLIGLYTGIVLYVANLIRGFTSNWTQRVMFWNLPDPRRLIRLCQDIILARMDGDLLLEEELSNELLQIYRSPESLIENTRLIVSPDESDDDAGAGDGIGNEDDEIGDDDDDFDDEALAPAQQPSHMRHRRSVQY